MGKRQRKAADTSKGPSEVTKEVVNTAKEQRAWLWTDRFLLQSWSDAGAAQCKARGRVGNLRGEGENGILAPFVTGPCWSSPGTAQSAWAAPASQNHSVPEPRPAGGGWSHPEHPPAQSRVTAALGQLALDLADLLTKLYAHLIPSKAVVIFAHSLL